MGKASFCHIQDSEGRIQSYVSINELGEESYKQLMVGTGMDLGIYLKDKLIGKIKVSNIVHGVFKSAIIGYSIDKEHQGRGYMKEAVLLVEKYCKQYLDLHRLEASVLVDNNKSKRVLLKSGFEEIRESLRFNIKS